MKRERRRIFGLIFILVAASLFTGITASVLLYSTALKGKSDFLLTEVMNMARLIEAVARFDRGTFTDVGLATKATLSQVEAAFKDQIGVGETGEILMGRREGKKIAIFLRYSDHRINQNLILPHDQARTEAMELALAGETGVGRFLDLRGEPVLAAYTYIAPLKIGLEIKVAMSEISRPYIFTGFIIAVASGAVIALCIFLAIRVTRPVLQELEKHRRLTEAVVESAQDIILSINREGFLRLVNPATEQITGYTAAELNGRDFSLLFDTGDAKTLETLNSIRSQELQNSPGGIVQLRKKNGDTFPASISSGTKLMGEDPLTTIVLHDLTALKKSEDTIRMLTHRMIEIKDQEQDNISKELHDTIGTNLVWLKLQAQQLLASVAGKEKETRALMQNFDNTVEMTRNLSHHLSPVAVEKLPLRVLFERLAERAAHLTKTRITIANEIPDMDFPARTRFHVLRIVQEILNNALKHAEANEITIGTGHIGNRFFIRIIDDGRGFDTSAAKDGLGLSLIAERVSLLKGSYHIHSKPGRGTEVSVEFPVA